MPSVGREQELTDRLRARARPLPPQHTPSPKGGRPRADDRARVEAVVSMLRNGLRWRDLPDHFPSPATAWRRHAGWAGGGIREQVRRAVLDELADAGLLDTGELYPDRTFAPARRGAEVGATECGKGRKVGMAVERAGVPVGVLTDAATVGEPGPGERVPAGIPPEVELPDDGPVVADRGFDSDGLRDDLAGMGLRRLAPHRKNRKRPSRDDGRRMRRYRRRYVAGRTFGWLHRYRRLLVRHEYCSFICDGSVHLACALIASGRF